MIKDFPDKIGNSSSIWHQVITGLGHAKNFLGPREAQCNVIVENLGKVWVSIYQSHSESWVQKGQDIFQGKCYFVSCENVQVNWAKKGSDTL